MTDRKRSLLALVGAALLWSLGGVGLKGVDWHPLALMSARSAFSALFLFSVMGKPKFDGSPAQIGAGVANAMTVILYVPAVKMTTAANAILIQYTAPIWVALLGAWLLKERPTWLDGLTLAITLGGLALFFRDGFSGLSSYGDLLALLSGVSLAVMTLLLRKQKQGNALESIFLGCVLSALFGLYWVITEPWPPLRAWIAIALMGFFQHGLAHVLYCRALRHVTALEAILVSTLEPVLNPIWVALVIHEYPQGWALAGGMMVLLSVTVRGVVLSVPKARAALLGRNPS